MKSKLKVKNIVLIIFGAALVAFGLVHFNMENKLAEGGFTGVSLIFYFLFDIPVSISYLVMNIPIFVMGWIALGKKSVMYTIIGTTSLSLWLAFFERDPYEIALPNDLMLASVFAGVFAGAGLGIIFRFGGTTGGIDIIAKIVQKKLHVTMGRAMFIFDFAVLTLSLVLYLNYRQAMYTMIAVFIAAKIIDFLNEGLYESRGATIISQNPKAIADAINKELGRGVTFLRGHGYYSQADKDVVYCVVGKKEIHRLKDLIASVDPEAFVTVSVVQDVLGEGFTFDRNRVPFERD